VSTPNLNSSVVFDLRKLVVIPDLTPDLEIFSVSLKAEIQS
jgi:hypothetical protein